ncbi:MAG: ATP-grasp domain-containing protein [Fibrobacter sp.]|nr:ATP-grasp domain-containing protein [Fibrobacter sp.]
MSANVPQKRLLLLGGGHAEIPLIQAAQSLGYYVITTGNAREGLGHPYADKNVFEDFSDKDAMLELARREKVSAVCSGCNDFALLSTVYVCEKLGLPGHDSYETSLRIHHKDKYRALAERLNIPTPRAVSVKNREEFNALFNRQWITSPSARNEVAGGFARHCEEYSDEGISLNFPVIIKPVDLTGGKGIHRADDFEEACSAYDAAMNRTREDHLVVEEFVTGTNHGFSAFLIGGKVAFYFVDNEQYYLNKYMVSGANTPTTTSEHGLKLLCEYSERIAADLKLVDGILHIQYIERDDGIPVIIEICRRPPGDLYIKFVKYATGVDYPRAIILAETGMLQINDLTLAGAVNVAKFVPSVKPFLRHCVMASREGVVQGVSFAPEIEKNVVEKFLWFKKGEPTGDILYYKAGIVFLQFDSVEEMLEKTARMTDLIQVSLA